MSQPQLTSQSAGTELEGKVNCETWDESLIHTLTHTHTHTYTDKREWEREAAWCCSHITPVRLITERSSVITTVQLLALLPINHCWKGTPIHPQSRLNASSSESKRDNNSTSPCSLSASLSLSLSLSASLSHSSHTFTFAVRTDDLLVHWCTVTVCHIWQWESRVDRERSFYFTV